MTTKAIKMTMTPTPTLRMMTLRNGGGGGKTRGNREGTNGYIPPSLGSLLRSHLARSIPRPLICLSYSFPRPLAHTSLRPVACSHRCLIRHDPRSPRQRRPAPPTPTNQRCSTTRKTTTTRRRTRRSTEKGGNGRRGHNHRYVVTGPSSSPVHAHLSPSTSSPRRPQRPIPRLYPPPPLVCSTSPTSDPLSRPPRSLVRPALPSDSLPRPTLSTRSLAVLPSPLSLHDLMPTGPLAHRPARPHRPHRLAHRMRCPDPRSTHPHLPLDAALACSLQLDTTAVHHPDTSSTFPLPPPPPPLSPPPPPTPPLPLLPPPHAAPLSCGAPCPAPAAETAPCNLLRTALLRAALLRAALLRAALLDQAVAAPSASASSRTGRC
ncbi:hypothetical protein HETIRDRAFT_447176 [Heterobasidion irregulare TC 32-1]|uniref:Uncharacterized protein n=1 Tax=Heterobasidion irregulare (strain TC 32-1) TaxID=747525 RepID=W4KL32_HETIT|nr:uncharacterized protein HETIRDRAFT_447176 [Heterobasidion irregulare TC 32-1]ETW86399.1 hypothetical protein HETIRDRAFT_447176 [Heterobasidion irregulare TC 32-1]